MQESHRLCAIMFDEMSLKKELSYNKATDLVEGLVELPEKKSDACNQALVFLLRGITVNWKQPVGFFFSSNSAPSLVLHDLLLVLLQRVFAVGLMPVVIICDQAAANRALFGGLGVTVDKPYIQVRNLTLVMSSMF